LFCWSIPNLSWSFLWIWGSHATKTIAQASIRPGGS
jgi:hypothetical protein